VVLGKTGYNMICCAGFDNLASSETSEVPEGGWSDESMTDAQTCDSSIQVVTSLH